MKVLAWRKSGVDVAFVGMRSTRTGELREASPEEKEDFIANFKGKELLEEPITEREQ